MKFQIHTTATAPEASRAILAQTEKTYGFRLNLFGVLAESPVALSAYVQISALLKEHSAFSPQEQQIVMLALSEANGCDYCVAAHTAVAEMNHVSADLIEALRDGRTPADPEARALVRFAKLVMAHRGWVPEEEQQAFLEAGFTPRHVLDLLSIVALKSLSNFANHLAQTPLDPAFEPKKWTRKE